jgi:formylglycine-generating enzyme required for sulfatase activity
MHGNVWCLCQDRHRDYPQDQGGKPIDDIEDILNVANEEDRVLRGGSFSNPASIFRAADRHWYRPSNSNVNTGFRTARTFR